MGVEKERGQPLGDTGQAERDLGRPIKISEDTLRRSLHTGSTRPETNTPNMEQMQPTPLLLIKQLADSIAKTKKRGG